MNKVKLLAKLDGFFDADDKNNAEQIESVLIKLKNKLIKIQRRMTECKNEAYKTALQLEAEVLIAQIEKGEKYLKMLYQIK